MKLPGTGRGTGPGAWTLAASGCILAASIALAACAEEVATAPQDVAATLAVQLTDQSLRTVRWREDLDLAVRIGASVVRVDFNWPWTETEPGRYDWSTYDALATELSKRRLRPLFILHRPNRLHGRSLDSRDSGDQEPVVAPPRSADEITAFGRWAAAAALHFKALRPIWEIWNEPDGEGFWPPRPNPTEYTRLARATCDSIKSVVPDAFVVGPAAAEMPTVWDATKPLVNEVLRDVGLMRCLDAVSLHTHRFGQTPETVSRDYAVFRKIRAGLSAREIPIVDTEWGDSVYRSGLTEARQASWLTRMFLTNIVENIALTNWYCLVDTGDDEGEMEDRFGLVTRTGRLRPGFLAYRTLSQALRGHTLRNVIARFDPETAKGTTVLMFCRPDNACKIAAWTTEMPDKPLRFVIQGWGISGPIVGHLGQRLPSTPQDDTSATLSLSTDVQFVPIKRLSNDQNGTAIRR
ncbi:hypothetical protein [Methylobacterium sp. WL120]|uniref:hypothetical protein n=1 Tax=Methylobacterium sp. WL120 TaxID=2603887 RepID=UPI0011C8E90B|nr:hypothetical protein [Methylobacterium sp. WL120]TXM68824.1 hypothetical protein FV229_06880 [Methylobacterium sp. WL120]